MVNLVKNMSAFDSFIRLKYKEGVWWNYGKPTHPLYADLWEAWQAQQAKIDELQGLADAALKSIMICEEYNHAEKLDEIYNILKAVEK